MVVVTSRHLIGSYFYELVKNGFEARISFVDLDAYADVVRMVLEEQGYDVLIESNNYRILNLVDRSDGMIVLENKDLDSEDNSIYLGDVYSLEEIKNIYESTLSDRLESALFDERAVKVIIENAIKDES